MDSKQIKQEILDACQAAGEGDVITVTAENLLLAFGETVTKKPKPKKEIKNPLGPKNTYNSPWGNPGGSKR